MKKRLNLAALIFWVFGGLFLLGDIPVVISLHNLGVLAAHTQGITYASAMMPMSIWAETRSAFLYGGQLIGIGVLIELVDQIRWNGLNRPIP